MASNDEIDFIGVPDDIARAFRRGLEDVKHGRVVSVEAAVAEGRLRVAEHRRASTKQAHGRTVEQRSETIP
jgi:hypothetical protein